MHAVKEHDLVIIGGGLAGSEAAWQAATQGLRVLLYEMRPVRQTPAHQTAWLAELVCSNSLKSAALDTAPGLLKEELRRLGSLVLRMADAARIRRDRRWQWIVSSLHGRSLRPSRVMPPSR